MKPIFDNRPTVKKRRLNPLPENPESNSGTVVGKGRFPSWLHRKLPEGNTLWQTQRLMREKRLHTVCEEAKCPNLLECWTHKTATYLVLGKSCTRACGFCDIETTKNPPLPDANEPKRVAESAKDLGLKHIVITMVARDDLSDGGAAHVAEVIRAVRSEVSDATVEVLTTDFGGNREACDILLKERPEIFNHNIETVRRMTPRVRHVATYEGTLSFLKYIKNSKQCRFVKSGLMLGLGETEEEVFQSMEDLQKAGCDIITMGQYLQPNRHKLRVKEFIHPSQFDKYAENGKEKGMKMFCGPFVRSSYNAGTVFEEMI